MGPDPATGLPQHFRRDRHLRSVRARPTAGPRGGSRPRRAPQEPDGRLAVQPRHGHDLVQELVLLGSSGLLVPQPLNGSVLAQAGSCHGPLPMGIGNRDF